MSFEELRVYQAAQELRKEVDKLRVVVLPRFSNLFEHIDDAVDSVANNIAEGSASKYPAKRANYYDIAAGSAREVRSGIRSIHRRGGFGNANVFRPIVLTLAIGKMLRVMTDRLQES